VIVEHRQGDVGQQRRQDPALGVPVVVFLATWSSPRIPALQNAFTSRSTRWSPIRRRTRSIRAGWSMVSKHASMSASSTHSYERLVKAWISAIASCVRRLGRKP